MKFDANRKKGLWIGALAALSFGLYPACAKMSYDAGANSTFMILLTTFSRAFSLTLFSLLIGKRVLPNRDELPSVVSGGFFQSLSIFGIIGSLVYLPGPVTIVIIFTHTILLLFFLALKGEQRLDSNVIGVTLVALFGLSLVVDVWGHLHGLNPVGIVLAFLASFATMSRLYVFGKQTQVDHPAVVGARVFSCASFFTLGLLVFSPALPPVSGVGMCWALLCCFSLVFGTFAMFYGIALLGAFQFSLIVKLEPVFTAIFSLLISKEYLALSQYLGMALVLGSLLVYQFLESKRKSLTV